MTPAVVPPEVARITGFRIRADRWAKSLRLAFDGLEASEDKEDQNRLRSLRSYGHKLLYLAQSGQRTPMNWKRQRAGRWSTSQPNMHGITKGFGLREAMVPERGMVFVRGDWRSAHLIIAAGLSRDGRLQSDLEHGDAYTRAMAHLAPELGGEGRSASKVIILSSLNGAGPECLADILQSFGVGVGPEEAGERRSRWLSRYPKLMRHMESVIVDRSWTTPLGNEISLPADEGKYPDYVGLGWRWQSYEADAMQIVLRQLATDRPRWPVAFICYDEILLEVPPAEADFASVELQSMMDEALRSVSRLSTGNRDNTTKTSVLATWGGETPHAKRVVHAYRPWEHA